MGARPSQFTKKGGGKFNNIDGVITGYELTDTWPGNDGPQRSASGFLSLYCVVSARMDGASSDEVTILRAGDADEFTISADGHTLTPTRDREHPWGGTPFASFLETLCNPETGEGFPEDRLPADENNWEAMIGTRVRFIQVPEMDNKTGKQKTHVAKDGKYKGKTFQDTTTAIGQVYALPGGTSVRGRKSLGAAAPKSVPGKAVSKPNGKLPANDVSNLAEDTLTAILAAQPEGTIAKAKLRMKIFNLFTAKHPQREQRDEVVKYLFNDDNLGALADAGLITYDASDTDQVISAA